MAEKSIPGFCELCGRTGPVTEMDLLANPGPGHGVSGDLRKRLLHVADDDHAPVR